MGDLRMEGEGLLYWLCNQPSGNSISRAISTARSFALQMLCANLLIEIEQAFSCFLSKL